MDIFSGGQFIELPSVSIFEDCESWDFVLLAGFEWLAHTGQIVGDELEIEYAINDLIEYLAVQECAPSGAYTSLFADDYAVDEVAPVATPRLYAPIGESEVVQQDSGSFKVLTGEMVCASAKTANSWTTLYQQLVESFQRKAGLAFKVTIKRTGGQWRGGWNTSGGEFNESGFAVTGLILSIVSNDFGGASLSLPSLVNTVYYTLAVICRLKGAFYYIKGGVYTAWTLVFVERSSSAQTLKAGVTDFGGRLNTVHKKMRVSQLLGDWQTDTGTATDVKAGTVSAGTTWVHEPDFFMVLLLGTLSATVKYIRFRIQDASNYWELRVTNTSIQLWEVVAGVGAMRSSGTIGVTTPSLAVSVYGQTILAWVNSPLKINYTLAATFTTETDAALDSGADIYDVETYAHIPAAVYQGQIEGF